MQVESLSIPDVKLVTPPRYGDARGWFSEVFNDSRFTAHAIGPFQQDNQSMSAATGTVRGLHCQLAPDIQGKLVRCVHGSIWDVAIDAREGSPTYGTWAAATLSAASGAQLWVPPGFLHGFCTLEPDTEVLYKVTAPYNRQTERAVRWNDPALALPWPLPPGGATLSDKDQDAPDFAAAAGWFPGLA